MKAYKPMISCLLVIVLLLPAAAGFALPKVTFHGSREAPMIAITMDDCWKTDYVEQMLDLCKQYDFHMTFFPCGISIRPDTASVWLRIIEEGHEIGNHTQNHRKLTRLDGRRVGNELNNMKNRLDNLLGYEYNLLLMRPPYGAFGGGNGSNTSKAIEKQGYSNIIMWSLSQTDPDKMLKKVKNGDILLYHSNKKDVEGLKKAIPILLERGFQLVTVTELLDIDTGAENDKPQV